MRTLSLVTGLVGLAVSAGPLGGQAVGARPTPDPKANPSGKPTFIGTVRIASQFADPGTVVDVVIFRSGQTPIPCAHGTVDVRPIGPNESSVPAFLAPLDPTPVCLNPDNVYHFYVNGVHAPQQSGSALPGTKLTYVNLTVTEAALRTDPEQGGVRLVWFYGKVRDKLGRPPPDSTIVTADAGGDCKGTGKTQDLFWEPKTAGARTIGALGWYLIPVEMSKACADRRLEFRLWAGPKDGPGKPSSIKTPPYGVPVNVDLVMPTP